MKKKFPIINLCLLWLFVLPQISFSYSSPDSTLAVKVDLLVQKKMNQYQIPGLAIGIVKDQSLILAKGYGVTNIATGEKVSSSSIFHTASISKLLTAQALLILIAEKGLNLEDKLIDLVPELNFRDEQSKQISLKNLLNHTAGLPDISNYQWKNNNRAASSLSDYIIGQKIKTRSVPGTKYYYSNLGYDLIGYIIEKQAGVSFEEYVSEKILKPAAIQQSDFRYYLIADSLKTSPHTYKKGIVTRKVYPYTREHAPSSTLNASVEDLSKWMIHFLQGLHAKDSHALFSSMIQPSTEVYSGIGLGFQLGEVAGYTKVGHYGGDRGFRSYLIMIPEKNIGLVLLANCDYNEDFRQEILHSVVDLILSGD